jgi:hypothetical protein
MNLSWKTSYLSCHSWEWILSSVKKNWGNNVDYRPLDHKYKTILKSKKNWEKLIDGWDVKIEENWGFFFWEDPFSSSFFNKQLAASHEK